MDLTTNGFSWIMYFDPLWQMIEFFSSKNHMPSPIPSVNQASEVPTTASHGSLCAVRLWWSWRTAESCQCVGGWGGCFTTLRRMGWSFGYDSIYTWGEGFEDILGVQVHDGDVPHLGDWWFVFVFLISSWGGCYSGLLKEKGGRREVHHGSRWHRSHRL